MPKFSEIITQPEGCKLRIIEQWGNGLRLISEELRKYSEIGFEWKEPGLAFRVAFIKKLAGIKALDRQRNI